MAKSINQKKYAQAKKLYLESGGRKPIKDIAATVGASRKTVSRWIHGNDWPAELMIITTASHEETVELVIDDIKTAFSRDLRHIRMLADQIEAKLSKPDLSANEIRQLAAAKSESVRLLRLLTNQSTANLGIRGSISKGGKSRPAPPHPDEDQFNQAIGLIMRHGDAAGQEALARLVEVQQAIMERYDELKQIDEAAHDGR